MAQAASKSSQKDVPPSNFEKFQAVTDNSLVMIYGPTRAGKTFLAIDLAVEAIGLGIPTIYIDTEGNVTGIDKQRLGKAYKPIYDWKELFTFCKKPPKGKLLVVDSPTLPILGAWAGLRADQHGAMMQELHQMVWGLKQWTAENDGLCMLIGQDKSELSKFEQSRSTDERGKTTITYWQDPFGGKAVFFIKEIFRLVPTRKDKTGTRSMLMAHDCRRYGRSASIADLTITDKGLKLDWRVNPASAAPPPAGISDEALKHIAESLRDAPTLEVLEEVKKGIPWHTLTKEQFAKLGGVGKQRKKELEEGNDGVPF